MNPARIVFAGTPEFARRSLSALTESGHRPVAVLTQPDRRAGRGKKLTASPVKQYAEDCGIDVLQPKSLRDDTAVAALKELRPDVIVVAAYGLLLPQTVLDIPMHGCLNVHASLLPRWRGAAPIQAAILAGDQRTGISLMAMMAGLDCGPVYLDEALSIGDDETAGELHDRLATLGSELLVANLQDIIDGQLLATEQDDARASYASKISQKDAEIDWRRSASDLQRHVRAYNPVPGGYFFADGARIKCWRAALVADVDDEPGTVVAYSRDRIVIACGKGGLSLEELQLPGKRRAEPPQFVAQLDLSGQRLDVG